MAKKASVIRMLTIKILTENLVYQRGLLAEHGLSFWIENGPDRVLFDTGQTDVFKHNAGRMGLDLTTIQGIVISHGHYDHGNGLPFFPFEGNRPRVFVHPDAFIPKYSKAAHLDEAHQATGMSWDKQSLPQLEGRLMLNTSTMQISESMTVLSDIPQTVDFESVSQEMLVEKHDALVQDSMRDEQILVISQPIGLTVVVGCSHPGIINALKYVQLFFPDQPIHTVIGGMHLQKVSQERLQKTIDAFKKMDIAQLVPLHCTGQNVIWRLKRELGDRVLIRCTGGSVEV